MKEISYQLCCLLAMLVGFSLASQAGVNSQLRSALTSPFQAAFVSFLVGTIFLFAIILLRQDSWGSFQKFAQIPWWVYTGGLLGAFNITMSIFLVPRMGAVTLTILVVFGQLLASLLYERYGLVGYPKLEITIGKVVGVVFLFVGAALVLRK